jgi:hypothetical protein
MKINEILAEAEIDDLIAQFTAPEVKKPGIVDRFNASAQRGANSAATRKANPGIIGGALNGVAKGIDSVSNTIANTTKGIPTSYATALPNTTQGTAPTASFSGTSGEPVVAPQNAEYLRKLANNKVATTGTDSPEVNAVIKSAGLLK